MSRAASSYRAARRNAGTHAPAPSRYIAPPAVRANKRDRSEIAEFLRAHPFKSQRKVWLTAVPHSLSRAA